MFILLDAPYLAMLQTAIYVGAVVVLILFTIMLVQRGVGEELVDKGERGGRRRGHVDCWTPCSLDSRRSGAGRSKPTLHPSTGTIACKCIGAVACHRLLRSTRYTRTSPVSSFAWSLDARKGGKVKMVALVSYIVVSAALLGIGIYGLSVKRNAIRILFAVEIIVNAANINFTAFSPIPESPIGYGSGNSVLFNCRFGHGGGGRFSLDSARIQAQQFHRRQRNGQAERMNSHCIYSSSKSS